MEALREGGLTDVAVVVGGIVPDEDEQMLLDAGVARVFHPGATLAEIAGYINDITPGIRARRLTA
jgi:methylmalonyl-CoA mutase cobalamin-binding domain/chain